MREAPDDYRKNIKVEVIVGFCEHCGGEVYLGDEHYRTNEGRVHQECFMEFAESVLDAELVEGLEGALC